MSCKSQVVIVIGLVLLISVKKSELGSGFKMLFITAFQAIEELVNMHPEITNNRFSFRRIKPQELSYKLVLVIINTALHM